MSIVCGLDPSLTSAGVAILVDGRPARLTSIGDKEPAPSFDARSDRITRQCRLIVEDIEKWAQGRRIDIAVIEGQAYGMNMPGTSERNGLWWRLYGTLRARRIPIAIVQPKTRALWATGDGDADKKAVVAAVKTWWPHAIGHIRNDDIADAAVFALMAALHLGDPMPFIVKPQHYHRMEVVKWPIPGVEARFTEEGVLW